MRDHVAIRGFIRSGTVFCGVCIKTQFTTVWCGNMPIIAAILIHLNIIGHTHSSRGRKLRHERISLR